jgi:predicted transcriptional regulator
MPVHEPLGALESAVMEAVWRRGPVTAREVCDGMTGRRERAYTTIMTTMDRLHRKGLLSRHKEGLAWRYEPALSRPDFERAVASTLASRILSSNQETALSAFVDATASVDESLLDRLRQLIDMRRRRPR